jgi:solute carrier family 25 (mitochondrial folate transporter), member 32
MITLHRRGITLSPVSVETLAGLSAGLVSTIIGHPLDVIKTRLQLSALPTSVLGASIKVFRGLLHTEGSTRLAALYRGLTPNLVGNSAGWALYFLWYRQFQDLIRKHRNYAAEAPLTSADYLLASAGSGAVTALLTNPIWVVKTRMLSTSAKQRGAYKGTWDGLISIGRTEGLRGYFHGLTPSLVGISHGALYFVAYEKLKMWKRRSNVRKGRDPGLTNFDTILTSCLSKVFAGSLTYPHQMVRARLQTYDPTAAASATSVTSRPGLTVVIRNIWRNEGLLAFYKGLGPNLLRVLPSTCVTFLVYENVRWGLPRLLGEEQGVV